MTTHDNFPNLRTVSIGFLVMGAIAAFVIAAGLLTAGCKPEEVRSATFAAELETCMQTADTCDRFVECQHAVQRRYNQPQSGSCDLADAGQDGAL